MLVFYNSCRHFFSILFSLLMFFKFRIKFIQLFPHVLFFYFCFLLFSFFWNSLFFSATSCLFCLRFSTCSLTSFSSTSLKCPCLQVFAHRYLSLYVCFHSSLDLFPENFPTVFCLGMF